MVSTFTGIFTKKQFLISDVATFSFDLKDKDRLDFLPGQYLIMHVPRPGQDDARRIFSLINTPGRPDFEFLAKIIPGGVASEYFMRLKAGDEVVFQGPAGLFAMHGAQKPKVFIATGTGIAPILSILRAHLPHYSAPFYLIWGLKTKSDIYLLSELEEFTTQYSNFRYFICLSRETPIEGFEKQYQDNIVIGRVNKKIGELLLILNSQLSTEFYICGDRNIVEDIRQYLLSHEIPKESISFEKFV